MLGAMLLSAINLAYYQELMAGMRDAIARGRFAEFRAQTREGWEKGDLAAAVSRYSAGRRRCGAEVVVGVVVDGAQVRVMMAEVAGPGRKADAGGGRSQHRQRK